MGGQWPFVGRVRELARIEELLGAGVGAIVLGESGVGKSALAREVGRRAAERGVTVRHVMGHAVSSGTPYEALGGALSELPELPEPSGPAGPSAFELDVAEVVARMSQTLEAGASRRPLLVVDDIQLLDQRSAQVLLRMADAGSISVLATAHLEDRLPEAVERLWREDLCQRVELDPLPGDDVADLLESVLDGPVERTSARAFADRSGGNPLFLRELVSAALERSLLVRRGAQGSGAWALNGDPEVSSGIRGAVSARLAGLSDDRRAALELVAAGEPLSANVAADLVGETVLDELTTERLVTVRAGLAGPEVSTAHPVYGDVLRADLPPLRLHRLRLALARRLESGERPTSHDLVRAAVWRLDSGRANDPKRLLVAARAARHISLDTAERLTRHAYDTSGSLPAALLLAEILVHTGRTAEAAELTARLPPQSLGQADREAMVYCQAMGQGLLAGDPGGGADLVEAVLAGDPAASDRLRALHASMLAFDAKFDASLDVGSPIVEDPSAEPEARTLAAIGTVGATYWSGRHRDTVATADRIAPLFEMGGDVVPFNRPSIELLAICALIEYGDLDAAEQRATRLRRRAEEERDPFAGPRANYGLARVALMRGRAATARRLLEGCLTDLHPFDRFIKHHLEAMLARAAAMTGDVDAANAVLAASAGPRMKTYEPEDELAPAAVLAASLLMDQAAERAAWAGELAVNQAEWSVALICYHDAARYGRARHVLVSMREAVAHVDGTLAWCYLDHATALANRDPDGLDEVARRFESHGALLLAAEARAEAAIEHAAAGHLRAARASGSHAGWLWSQCEATRSPWLAGATASVPLTGRERQVAALAAGGLSDAAIADRLAISVRTVQTHLGHVYDKLGSSGRSDLALRLEEVTEAPG